MRRIGLVSDTHDLLRPEALAFLRGCDHIIHGGDICGQRILDALAGVAPLTVVRGNNDRGAWAQEIPETALLELDGVRIYAIHNLAELPAGPVAAGVRVVVSGHSHRPLAQEREGVLYINPGSAGPRRFKLPISAAELLLDGGAVTPRIVELVAR
ncbi:hypothetical protein VAR608DRAFT_3309 [Variovorax sp. HW608]|uniref:metallophosphoesterase family protein n=1 Tax=Variovorax sp. HW608 TaxID=1034889 RepID=UPI0008200C5D|nr:metallophosphoesterase family protein [Variovorax sp. HW608]SCK36239.1 hypothetical protein VAR608DRAFT_3309 [Variovorax sp. HW608]